MVYQIRWRNRFGGDTTRPFREDEGWQEWQGGVERPSLEAAVERYLINSTARYAPEYDYQIREANSETIVWEGHMRNAGVPIEGTWYDGSPCPSSVAVLVPYKRAFGARYRAAR